ncbi:subtilase cytotoxin subunit B [Escherichia coli]|uniref:subtilase family AB5 toxin binding subunit n=1 Tax=Escherichia TaxID=561 RepID=UPI0005425AB9|nr:MULTISPECIES: subtilase family AB5 toxin binding subunit [Escherichia]EKH5946451.1 subtilase cytotoxin subunit B [Escherichia coli O103]EEQ3497004.1 subtilase cytotoxin subunit B [Escherichia coli]EEX9090261.1 subtilase cytotoxin subunit B [Escherichia coli]EEY1041629.1 subtilase cytotoxin subunit B [Escherichia coli]EEY1046513.1 subtilase cytotoxin subunit B [Escherichia coli]
MKVWSALFLSMLVFTSPAKAEWTGDKTEGMYSEVMINKIHTGQFNSSPYFCLEAEQSEDKTIKACLLRNDSKWHPSFDTLYLQTMYFYTTGERIRLYYEPNVWNNEDFKKSLTSNALVGYSTCKEEACFGPIREKDK